MKIMHCVQTIANVYDLKFFFAALRRYKWEDDGHVLFALTPPFEIIIIFLMNIREFTHTQIMYEMKITVLLHTEGYE